MRLTKRFNKNTLRKLAEAKKAKPTIEDILDAYFGYDENLLRKAKSTVSKALILGCELVIEERILDLNLTYNNILEAKYGTYIIDKKSGRVILECNTESKQVRTSI